MHIPEGKDLRGANLQGANLKGADHSNAYLTEANLKRADFHKADFYKANLKGANLQGADLTIAHHLSLDQFSKVKSLHDTKLNEEFLIILKGKYGALFEVSEPQIFKDQSF